MSTGGWIVMIVSVSAATLLFTGCIFRVLFGKDDTEHMTGWDMVETEDEVPEEEE